VAQWVVRLTRNVEVVCSSPIKKIYPYCLVLVGSRSRFERDLTIKLKYIEGLMEDIKYLNIK